MLNNRDEIIIKDFDQAINDWKIPKQSYDQIYQMKKWKLLGKSNYVITTEEKDIPIKDGLTTIRLLNKDSIKQYAKN